LYHREAPQAATCAAGDAHAAAGEIGSLRGVRRTGGAGTKAKRIAEMTARPVLPKHAGVYGEVESADGEARGVAGKHGEERSCTDYAREWRHDAKNENSPPAKCGVMRPRLRPEPPGWRNSPSRRTLRARIDLATLEQA